MPRKAWQRAPGAADTRHRGRRGQQLRKQRLARTGGLCERCFGLERTSLATVVNHKIPLALGGHDVDENTENLCGDCDLKVTAEQFGKAVPIEGRGVGADGRPTSEAHLWNRRRP